MRHTLDCWKKLPTFWRTKQSFLSGTDSATNMEGTYLTNETEATTMD